MRHAARVDGNQSEIVAALRRIGAQVVLLHQVGKGCPDLLACFRGRNILIECKQPGEFPNKEQVQFIAQWGGELHVVKSPEEAVAAVIGKEAMA